MRSSFNNAEILKCFEYSPFKAYPEILSYLTVVTNRMIYRSENQIYTLKTVFPGHQKIQNYK